MRRVIVGIDPGKSGGIVAVGSDSTRTLLAVHKMPDQLRRLHGIAKELQRYNPIVYIEQTHATPTMSRTTAYSFGVAVGWAQLAATIMSQEIVTVSAMKWQKYFGLTIKGLQGGAGKNETLKKRVNKQAANELFPEAKLTNATADAALIACYGRDQYNESLF